MNNNYYLCKKAHFKVASRYTVLKALDKIHIQMSIVPILFFLSYILMINFVWLSHSTVNVVVISLELKERNLDWTEEEDRRRQDCKTARPKTTLILQELRLLDYTVILFTVTLMPCMQNICN